MRVAEALGIIHGASSEAPPFNVLLACGCAPLHLKTLLHAHAQQRLPLKRLSVSEGLYGDLIGTLERASGTSLQAVAIVLEWSDLDARLGFRSAARWSTAAVSDIVHSSAVALERLSDAIGRLDPTVRIALSLPCLPLPPLFHTAGTQTSESELELTSGIALFGSRMARRAGLAIVNADRLARESAPAGWFDLKSELLIGFPYTWACADALTAACARLLAPPSPKKGIITDLDDTLWSGIAGEVGAQGVSWDLAHHAHAHGLYQNLLNSLAENGTLVAVASKNDPELVKTVFEREDILLTPERIFPFEVHWQAKSGSVARVLEAWNIGAGDVIFVDDSPMELAEVEAAHPDIRCLRFPGGDYPALLELLKEIRDVCGKERITGEDALRLNSIRQGAEFRKMAEAGSVSEGFLEHVGAVVTFDFSPSPKDSRVLELVNKTNQFNLNGRRRFAADWQTANSAPGAIVVVVSYEDKFGPLGKIAVLQGALSEAVLRLSTWVMSCRAFSRRIEHQCVRVLFDRFGLDEIQFDFAETPRNGPVHEFLNGLGGPAVMRAEFALRCPALFHRVVGAGNGDEEKT